MSRYASNCKWCGDRPGGCLYCVDENADNDSEKYLLVQQMIQRGEVHVLAIRHTEEVLLRHIAPNGARQPGSAAVPSAPVQRRCFNHAWVHDGIEFKHRYCKRPGCGVRQKFIWLPDSADVCGKWVDVTEPVQRKVAEAQKPRRKSVKGMKGRGMKKAKQPA
jgi:hypothetical protein